MPARRALTAERQPLYTREERDRRDATRWTLVQGILAPLQFLVFAISLALVARFLLTGEGLAAATVSIVVKTLFLYAIMVTGAIWEKVVFGRYLFAPAFYWEDMVSMGVIALHTAYLVALAIGADVHIQIAIALCAYATYAINATQFLLKLRAARLQSSAEAPAAASVPSPLAGEGGRGSDRMRGAGGALSGNGAAAAPHPYPIPQGERGAEASRAFMGVSA